MSKVDGSEPTSGLTFRITIGYLQYSQLIVWTGLTHWSYQISSLIILNPAVVRQEFQNGNFRLMTGISK